jgi:hypothetical protein
MGDLICSIILVLGFIGMLIYALILAIKQRK